MSQRANFLNEVGMLNRTPRSGFMFLGTGAQSVSQHMYRMLHIAFVLARASEEKVDELHLLHLVMFHDLPEARTGDHNYVNKKYVAEDLERLLADGAREWPYGEEIAAYVREFEARETPAAQLACDADKIELLQNLMKFVDARGISRHGLLYSARLGHVSANCGIPKWARLTKQVESSMISDMGARIRGLSTRTRSSRSSWSAPCRVVRMSLEMPARSTLITRP